MYFDSERKGTPDEIYLILDKYFEVIYYQLTLIILIIHYYRS
jgi:hypothetical protein